MTERTRARALMAVVTSTGAGLAAVSPSPAAILSQVPWILLVTLLANAAARGLSRFVLGYPSQRGGVHPTRRLRLMVVASVAFATSCLVALETDASVHGRWVAELGRMAVLIGAGVALARWCRSSELSPLYLAAALAVSSSVLAGLLSMVGLPHPAAVLLRLPQEAAVLWAGWHVAAIRGRSL